MKLGTCRINSIEDYRADFSYPRLYDLRRRSPEGFVQMFGDAIKCRNLSTEKAIVDSILLCAGEAGQTRDDIGLDAALCCIGEGRTQELWRDDNKLMADVIRERGDDLKRTLTRSAAQDVWLFEAFHRLAGVKAKVEDWDYLMEQQAGSQWTTEKAYGSEAMRRLKAIELPYCTDEDRTGALEIIPLTNDGLLPKPVRLAGTSLRLKLFRGDTLFALRRGELGYTGFLGVARGGEAQSFTRTFGCVSFSAGGAIGFGDLKKEQGLYHMPCPATAGRTVFIGGNSRLYRMEENGGLKMLGNPDNITIVQACSIAPGEYIVMDEKGCVRRLDEKGGDLDSSGAETIKAGAFAMAVHGGMCCVLMQQADAGVQLRLFGGEEAQRSKLRSWLAAKEKDKKFGRPCSLQTESRADGSMRMIVGFEGGGMVRYE